MTFCFPALLLAACASGSGGGGTGGQTSAGSGGRGGSASGGSTGTGGATNTGGSTGSGGISASGGNTGSGGTTGSGGGVGSGGSTGHGGTGGGGPAGGSGTGGSGTGGNSTGFTPYVCPTGVTSPTSFPSGSTATRITAPSDAFNNNGNNFETVEGPVWLNNALYVSEFGSTQKPPPSRILKIDANDNVTIAFPSIVDTGSNGLAIDKDGNLVTANHGVGGLTKINVATGAVTTITSMYMGKRFNSPNDLTVRADGTIYFTDPAGYQGDMVQPNQGVYMLAPGASSAVELISTLNQPNGVGLSLDGHTLYVDDAGDGVMTYAVNADGTIVTPGTPLDPTDLAHKNGDGVAIDCAGDFYVVIGSTTVYVVNPSGSTIGSITGFPGASQIANVAFGGPDHKTLYITSQGTGTQRGVYKLPMPVPGMPY
ncbi:MAG TPA: SMP-30/gluconolactonase/LRE family protein [Polyangia bacterium]|nr:SMP-30/gluconolactonase/LRE family protein [Polyangia bacterium]